MMEDCRQERGARRVAEPLQIRLHAAHNPLEHVCHVETNNSHGQADRTARGRKLLDNAR
jgi:hypothetical protein